ncbi:hypothetical protein FD755_014821, partial [Muntiacus reevesi]
FFFSNTHKENVNYIQIEKKYTNIYRQLLSKGVTTFSEIVVKERRMGEKTKNSSPRKGQNILTNTWTAKIPKPRGRPKMAKQPCPSESDMITEEDKSKKKGQEEKQPKKQLKKDEEGQKEEEKPRKEPDKKEGKKKVESKRKNLAKTGVTSTSDSEEEGDDQEGEKKRKGGRNFQTAHRRNMLKGQHEKEAADRKRKQEEQMETEHQTTCNLQ